MTSEDIRAWLDACGADGAPTVPGWYYCARGYRPATFVEVMADGTAMAGTGRVVPLHTITRHTPLPDFAAVARELEELRAKVASMEGAAREDSGSTFRVGQVWESPTMLTYRVVNTRPPERFNSARISMRQGADGSGRLFVKRGGDTLGWRLVTP